MSVAGTWQVALPDGVHLIEFEHGTATGKRIIRVDKKEVLHSEWMFKLVGDETFKIGKHVCTIHINTAPGFSYEYSLDIDGKPFEKFTENRAKVTRTWVFILDREKHRLVLEIDTMNLWLDGSAVESDPQFGDDGGTETIFDIDNHTACLKAVSSLRRRSGISHRLFIDGVEISSEIEETN